MYKILPSVKQYKDTHKKLVKPTSIKVDCDPNFSLVLGKLDREGHKNTLPSIDSKAHISLHFNLDPSFSNESYSLIIESENIFIIGQKESDLLFGIAILKQIWAQSKQEIDTCEIQDWPDMDFRGVSLDISRDKVPTVNTLKSYIDLLADLRMNSIQLYIEGLPYEFKSFKKYLKEDGYLTEQEYAEVEDYAFANGIDFIPNANGFGHMADFLALDEFKDLAECPDGIDLWGSHKAPSTLNPLDPKSKELVTRIYDDLLPNRKSQYFNMNFDEPFELGKGKSKEKVDEIGEGNVYIDYVLDILPSIRKYHKTPLIWCDVLLKHPELLYRLPKDMIFMEWGYEGNHPWDKMLAMLKGQGTKFIAACGTDTWCSYTSRTQEWQDNIYGACSSIVKNKGLGIIVTDWGDCGHHQFYSSSLLPITYAALCSWSCHEGQLKEAEYFVNKYILKDSDYLITKALLDAGKSAEVFGYRGNGTAPFYNALFIHYAMSEESPVGAFRLRKIQYPTASQIHILLKNMEYINEILTYSHPEDAYVKAEITQSLNLQLAIVYITFAANPDIGKEECLKALACAETLKDTILLEQKRLWFARNKTGNFEHSMMYLNELFAFSERLKNYPR